MRNSNLDIAAPNSRGVGDATEINDGGLLSDARKLDAPSRALQKLLEDGDRGFCIFEYATKKFSAWFDVVIGVFVRRRTCASGKRIADCRLSPAHELGLIVRSRTRWSRCQYHIAALGASGMMEAIYV